MSIVSKGQTAQNGTSATQVVTEQIAAVPVEIAPLRLELAGWDAGHDR
jgi:hypothetical protein